MQQQRALFLVLFFLVLDCCKLTKAVADVVKAFTKNNSVGAVNKANKLILRWIDVALDHFGLLGDGKSRRNAVLTSDCFDLFNAGVC